MSESLVDRCVSKTNRILNSVENNNNFSIKPNNFSECIYMITNKRSMSLPILAKKIGVSYICLLKWLKYEYCPSIDKVYKMECVLNIPCGYLYNYIVRDVLNNKFVKEK